MKKDVREKAFHRKGYPLLTESRNLCFWLELTPKFILFLDVENTNIINEVFQM